MLLIKVDGKVVTVNGKAATVKLPSTEARTSSSQQPVSDGLALNVDIAQAQYTHL
jgi:hypothetical protein